MTELSFLKLLKIEANERLTSDLRNPLTREVEQLNELINILGIAHKTSVNLKLDINGTRFHQKPSETCRFPQLFHHRQANGS